MYTNSIEEEKKLFHDLFESHISLKTDKETKKVCRCPKCKNGDIFVTAHIKEFFLEDGSRGFSQYPSDFICNNCHEKYDYTSINDDIFYHEPSVITENLDSPLGSFSAKCNGNPIPLRIRTYKTIYEEDSEAHIIPISIVDLDLSKLKKNDVIYFSFNHAILEYEDADEYEEYFGAENDDYMLRIRIDINYEIDDENNGYSYKWPLFVDNMGFIYDMKETPALNTKNTHHKYDHVSFQVAWIKKKYFRNIEKIYDDIYFLLDKAAWF